MLCNGAPVALASVSSTWWRFGVSAVHSAGWDAVVVSVAPVAPARHRDREGAADGRAVEPAQLGDHTARRGHPGERGMGGEGSVRAGVDGDAVDPGSRESL